MDLKKKLTNTSVTIGVIIVLIIIIFVLSYFLFVHFSSGMTKEEFLNKSLEGMWIGDDDFCQESGIDGVLLYIGEGETNKYKAMIIMHKENTIILEKKITIQIRNKRGTYDSQIKIRSTDRDKDEIDDWSEVMPHNLELTFDPINQVMIWKDGDTVYAKFIKDNLIKN